MKLSDFIALAALLAAGPAFAQANDHSAHHAPPAASAATAPTDGEVRKIDKAQGQLTLRHGPIGNLDMPGMTMVFKAADPKMLDTLQPGDKVRFTADKVKGVLTVTTIEAAR